MFKARLHHNCLEAGIVAQCRERRLQADSENVLLAPLDRLFEEAECSGQRLGADAARPKQ